MKLIEYATDWESHQSIQYLWLENDQVICSYTITISDDSIVLGSVWVSPEHRRKGLMYMMMDHFKLIYNDKEVWLIVYEKNKVAKNVYKKYGFKKCPKNRMMDNDLIFEWYAKF